MLMNVVWSAKLLCITALLFGTHIAVSRASRQRNRAELKIEEVRRNTEAQDDALCDRKQAARKACFEGQVFDAEMCSSQKVKAWLARFSADATLLTNWNIEKEWLFTINMTNETKAVATEATTLIETWTEKKRVYALRFPPKLYDQKTARQLHVLRTSTSLCNSKDQGRFQEVSSSLAALYTGAQFCYEKFGCLVGETAFDDYMQRLTDYDDLLDIWTGWNNASGPPLRDLFTERLQLANKGARENGYEDAGYFEWYTDYLMPNFDSDILRIFDEIKPLYEQLHAYVRFMLRKYHADRYQFGANEPIPAHLLGNLWAQNWYPLTSRVKPYADVNDLDVAEEMKRQNFTASRLFETAEEFYTSLGMPPMTDTFWNQSVIDKPTDGRVVDCHGQAADFLLNNDYRILMCTSITMDDYYTVHHEMGHVEYYMAYHKQPFLFRNSANTAFHEAIGDTIALAAMSFSRLQQLGLISEATDAEKIGINELMSFALQKLPFFGFSLSLDIWRWRTYNGSIKPEEYNEAWWKLRTEFSGVAPPVARNESYFDPGSKYHVTYNYGYIRYFVCYLLQFDFYRSMCKQSGHNGPLSKCNFYGSKEAGARLWKMMQLGYSKPWEEALFEMTGRRSMSADAVLEYFQPLYEWLVDFNTRNQVPLGWTSTERDWPTQN